MIIDQLTRRIREKAIFLAERSRSPSASAGEALVQETQSVIRGLVAALPPLEALLASNAAPPFAVYLALAGLTGHLAGLGAGQIPPVPPRYRHDDLLASFLPLIEFSLRRIDGIQMQYREMAFTQSEPGSFTLTLQPSWMRPRLIIGARRPAGAEHSAMAAWFARAFIASADQLPRLAELRILGAKRARIDRDDELGVIPSERLTLFAIDLDPTFIRANQALTIAARADGETSMLPVELVLFIATAGEEK